MLGFNKCPQSGFNKYSTPASELGKLKDLIIKTIKIINNNGIIILLIFSIPFVTPKLTITSVITTASACHNITLGLLEKLAKYDSVFIDDISPVKLIKKYFNTHPITTV
ncbi:Uncharacterised protein [Clostridioides difficile]|nr:Uncharacterised protein [Clostridioides difficile]